MEGQKGHSGEITQLREYYNEKEEICRKVESDRLVENKRDNKYGRK